MPEKAGFTRSLMLGYVHSVAAVLVSLVVGILPEGFLSQYYHNTWIETFTPAIAITAFTLGLAFSMRFLNGRGANLVWVFGLAWLAIGFFSAKNEWNPLHFKETNSWNYAMSSLFGPSSACGENFECDFNKLTYTMPFTVSMAYWAGHLVRRLVGTRSP